MPVAANPPPTAGRTKSHPSTQSVANRPRRGISEDSARCGRNSDEGDAPCKGAGALHFGSGVGLFSPPPRAPRLSAKPSPQPCRVKKKTPNRGPSGALREPAARRERQRPPSPWRIVGNLRSAGLRGVRGVEIRTVYAQCAGVAVPPWPPSPPLQRRRRTLRRQCGWPAGPIIKPIFFFLVRRGKSTKQIKKKSNGGNAFTCNNSEKKKRGKTEHSRFEEN